MDRDTKNICRVSRVLKINLPKESYKIKTKKDKMLTTNVYYHDVTFYKKNSQMKTL